MKKSDEMFKSWVAQMASQSTAIFLQTKEEFQELEKEASIEVESLKIEIEDYENNLGIFEAKFNDLKLEKSNYKKWWHEQLALNNELKKELKALQANLNAGGNE